LLRLNAGPSLQPLRLIAQGFMLIAVLLSACTSDSETPRDTGSGPSTLEVKETLGP
jgi:hypothetical protein